MATKVLLKALRPKPPSEPLDPRREAFCDAICAGARLAEAHQAAGFKGKTKAAAWQLRHTPEVDARINWLLKRRAEARSVRYAKRTKVESDLLEASIARLRDIAFTDVREIAAWREEALTNAEGEVIGTAQKLALRDSADISPQAAALISGAFLKAGEVRLNFHDQRAALVDLVKLLKGSDAAPPANVTVNQVNIGAAGAVDAVQRIAFLLASATSRQPAAPQPVTIDAKPTDHNS